jgi:hypothetical protein
LATSQRLLAIAIFGLLVAGIATAIVKGPEEEAPLVIAPTDSPTATPSETFTFPGPIPTESDTSLFPTDTPGEPGAEPTDSMSELPRTGGGSVAGPALLTLLLALAGGVFVYRSARSAS